MMGEPKYRERRPRVGIHALLIRIVSEAEILRLEQPGCNASQSRCIPYTTKRSI
jgi:hypothetical protein